MKTRSEGPTDKAVDVETPQNRHGSRQLFPNKPAAPEEGWGQVSNRSLLLATIRCITRPARTGFEGTLYHVTARSDRWKAIYEDVSDRTQFLEIFGEVIRRFNWVCHSYCQMTNHYHLVIETPDGNLSKGMRQLNGVYTQMSNRRHGRVGHLFQGRYEAILVDGDAYLLELSLYVVLNPVRAGMVKLPRAVGCGE